ncbi:MAG: hypothetical protein LBS84_10225 [Clostridiales bacterium]|nr:hypothetical protein [Clostridiales bacterium]
MIKLKILELAEEKGIEKGRQETKLETARALHAEGDSLEKIARTTKLQVEFLKRELNVG